MSKIYRNRVFITATGTPIYWNTSTPDSSGTSYPGPGTFGVDTEDFSSLVIPGGSGVGSYIDIGGNYSYTEAAVPVEEVLGQTAFNGLLAVSATTLNIMAMITPTLSLGSCSIKFYDIGPVGTPSAPRLVSTLTTSTSGGPQVLRQALTTVAAAPSTNEILRADHMYELIVTSSAQAADTVFVGGARIEVI